MNVVGEKIGGGSRSLRGEILDDGCPDLVQFVGKSGGLVPLDELGPLANALNTLLASADISVSLPWLAARASFSFFSRFLSVAACSINKEASRSEPIRQGRCG
jgi:hypothetical protein